MAKGSPAQGSTFAVASVCLAVVILSLLASTASPSDASPNLPQNRQPVSGPRVVHMAEIELVDSPAVVAALDTLGLTTRPGERPGYVIAEASADDEQALAAQGIEYTRLRFFAQAEGGRSLSGELAYDSRFAENDWDEPILEEIGHSGVHVWIDGAPADAVVEYSDIHVIIRTSPHSELRVDWGPWECLMGYSSGCAGVWYTKLPNGDIDFRDYHAFAWHGHEVNGQWWLLAKDMLADNDAGYIDYFSIRIYYGQPGAGPTPTATPIGYHIADIPALVDTFTNDGNRSANYNSAAELYAGYQKRLRTYIKFPVGPDTLPPGAIIQKADLMLYYLGVGGNVSLDVFAPTADWVSSSINWSNQPGYETPAASNHWVAIGAPTYIDWNITTLFQEWASGGRSNFGVMVTDHNDTNSCRIASKEHAGNNPPRLRVHYIVPQGPTATPTATRTPQPTHTPTATVTPTRTHTFTPFVTHTSTATPTRTPTTSLSSLVGAIRLHGRPLPPSALLAVPLIVKFYNAGGSTALRTDSVSTDANGSFTVGGLTPGVYDVAVKNAQTLSAKKLNVAITAGTTHVDFGTLLEGDANDDDLVDISDFSLLRTAFMKGCGQPGYDGRSDFNGDCLVDISDFSLLRTNFMRGGPVIVP